MRFIFSHFPPCVPPRLKFDWKLQSVKTKEVLFFFKYACSVQIILSGRIFDLGCLREIIITQQFFWLAFSAALPVLTNRRAVRLPLWIMLLLKKNKTRHFYLNYRIPNYAEFNTFSVCWSVTKYPRPQWRYQKKIRLDLHNVHLILRSHEAAFCQIDVASSSRWVAFPSIWAFPFIRITTLSLQSPWTDAGKDRGKEWLLAGMIVLQHNVINRTQFCRTFGENHFARSLTVCWAARQLLGDSPPGEQLWSTLWGLNYSFRMATCIQLVWNCGEDFASCSSPDSF